MIRLTLYFVIGLLLGGVSVFASAAGTVWQGRDGFIYRNADGTMSTIKAPPDPISLGERSLLKSMDRNGITLAEPGNWEVQDKGGNKIKIPGENTVKIGGAPLAKAAGAAAWLAKGTIAGVVIGLLAEEGIRLAGEWWERDTTGQIPPDFWWIYGSAITKDTAAFPTMACLQAQQGGGTYGHTGTWQTQTGTSGTVKCVWNSGQVTFAVGGSLRCPDGRWYTQGMSCGTTAMTVPATQEDLENALDRRRQMVDGKLADYYNAIDQQARDKLIKDGEYGATGTQVNGIPKTTTTTNTDGSTKSVTTNNTYNITHQGNTYNTSTVTVTSTEIVNTTQGGQTTTQQTTETGLRPQDDPKDTKTDCEKTPNAAGCQELGEVTDVELTRKNLEGAIVPESMGGEGTCPAPLTAVVGGQTVAMTFEPVCAVASGMRPLVIAVAWLIGAYILSGVVRGQQ